jgi:hypothetical protein
MQLLRPHDDRYRSERKSRSICAVACDWNFHAVNLVMVSLRRISVPTGLGLQRGAVVGTAAFTHQNCEHHLSVDS